MSQKVNKLNNWRIVSNSEENGDMNNVEVKDSKDRTPCKRVSFINGEKIQKTVDKTADKVPINMNLHTLGTQIIKLPKIGTLKSKFKHLV